MKRVLVLLPTTGYRNNDFLAAAKKLGVEIVTAANYCHQLAPSWGLAPIMALHFDRPEQAADTVLREIDGNPDAVLAVDDSGVELAALLAERLGLPGNPAHAVRRVRDKLAFRRLLEEWEFQCPGFRHLPSGDDPGKLVPELKFPVVVKARRLSGSRGVIRADDSQALVRAANWVRAIQSRADRDAQELGLIIEDFIPGREHALEGTLQQGELTTLALFDKPDPLDGPYFEETIYVTPSRLPEASQRAVGECAARAARALGLTDGPVHAELRIDDAGPWLIELAARSIGGLCARTLRFGTGMTLEEIILRHALGWPIASLERERPAAGVMMVPIPRGGILEEVRGLEAARAIAGIEDVTISIPKGHPVTPLPEGSRYLGFIFSRAETPAEAEASLRRAHALLDFTIR